MPGCFPWYLFLLSFNVGWRGWWWGYSWGVGQVQVRDQWRWWGKCRGMDWFWATESLNYSTDERNAGFVVSDEALVIDKLSVRNDVFFCHRRKTRRKTRITAFVDEFQMLGNFLQPSILRLPSWYWRLMDFLQSRCRFCEHHLLAWRTFLLWLMNWSYHFGFITGFRSGGGEEKSSSQRSCHIDSFCKCISVLVCGRVYWKQLKDRLRCS